MADDRPKNESMEDELGRSRDEEVVGRANDDPDADDVDEFEDTEDDEEDLEA